MELKYPLHAVTLPMTFDAGRLAADLACIPADAWQNHYNTKEYLGQWGIAPLRSVAGHAAIIHAVPMGSKPDFYADTALLNDCAYFRSVIEQFQCPIGAVRLMRLGSGAQILEHSDDMGAGDTRELRLHIAIQTNSEVDFRVAGHQVNMTPGALWFADFSRPHSVVNGGESDRIHLVLDCLANDWLCTMINRAMEVEMIRQFLHGIGIEAEPATLGDDTFLPGIVIDKGRIKYEADKLLSPGDLLHEAGHIAVSQHPETLTGNAGEGDPNALGDEIAVILWSYAAATAIGIDPASVFHDQGYKGKSDWFLANFTSGNYIGLPLLEWMGLTVSPEKALAMGVKPFPHMTRWTRARAGSYGV